MKTIEINGQNVNVLKEGVGFGGRMWDMIESFPRMIEHRMGGGNSVYEYTEDWEVMDTDDFTLFMNNDEGYMVYISKHKVHYEESKGLVTDKEGFILYTTI